MPHALLRAELEQAFAHLSPTARPPEWPVVMAMPDPAQPVWPPASAQAAAVPRAPPPLRDLAELSVSGEGDDLPTFIVIPHLGRVTLGQGDEAIVADIRHRFAMSKTPVTVGQWKRFWNAADRDYTPSVPWESQDSDFSTYCEDPLVRYFTEDYDTEVPNDTEQPFSIWSRWISGYPDDFPISDINEDDAAAYTRWFYRNFASKLGVTVLSVGLPSDLEWELAARGGRLTQDYLWDDPVEETLFAQTTKANGLRAPVTSHQANGYGLHDMIGNVREWTCSPWRVFRKGIPSNGLESAEGPVLRVVRGASFLFEGDWMRLSRRMRQSTEDRDFDVGFRLVARIAP